MARQWNRPKTERTLTQPALRGLKRSGDWVRAIPNRFPLMNSVNWPEKMNAAKLLIYRNLAAFSVVAGARNPRDRHSIEVPV